MTATDDTSVGVAADYNGLRQAEPSLPAAWYYDAGQFKTEMSTVWAKSWLYLCRSAALSGAGAYKTLSVGEQNILVLRTREGRLAGYFNVCRHRGSILLTEAEGTLPAGRVICPYHQWCYGGEDGGLIGTTSFAEPAGFQKAGHGLFRISVVEWRGFVFVNLDPDAVWDDEVAFQRGAAKLTDYPLERLVLGHRWVRQVACNWKSFWENFNECLHCPSVHPSLSKLVPLYRRRQINERDRPDWREHAQDPDPKYRGGLRPGAETWSMDGSAQGRLIPELSEADVARGQIYAVALPSAYIGCYGDHARIVRLLPLGPEAIELTVEWLFPPETLADPGYDMAKVVDFAVAVLEEDGRACELSQRGLHAAPYQAGVLMPEEYHLKTFHDWLRAALMPTDGNDDH
ncbi:MAG: aromatic ring-hydroxylating dioxygenase subunit alpha [Rhodospirillaceae bacterium]|jgi:Rieske 2Fe-2S family protein|nr:aromatic ring-hydroxylating dioxygenase subunit alpha [Rhodospirillaceae bacterium]MBT3494700.1 aromatic ring-hydroxylating dioxygenase subunit alpha [Rhodospirillaceae bacterium]MBT3782759.1 aromatic ring-hydroxylating dioxygenase subunit alpha [Rhodospirillaceae bacterium]MBT3975652.1 aromatic ring-hydroxylating dioxygenase subunit alpha [Rhodospirillaceae bacterium]MBT4168773.1 aromatic ring-hydroxylating dioxygenase subunit alpha [Rhodospirillaceae bacterium]